MNAKRTNIVHEILQVEKGYNDNLKVIIWKFIKPLEAASANPEKAIIPLPLIKAIFGTVEIIFNFNSILLEGVASRMKQWDPSKTQLGDLFLRISQCFPACYVEYINNYDRALDTLNRAKKDHPAFQQFLIKQENAKECRFMPLESFLVMPVQQVPRYVMLLQDIVKNTPKEHVDHGQLDAALAKMREVATKINERKREAENLAKVFGVQRQLIAKHADRITSLCTPSRRYIREGALISVGSSTSTPMHVFLFNDSMLLTVAKPKLSKYSFKALVEWTDQDPVKADDTKKAQNLFRVTGLVGGKKKKELVFSASSPAERDSWLSEIVALKRACVASSASSAVKRAP